MNLKEALEKIIDAYNSGKFSSDALASGILGKRNGVYVLSPSKPNSEFDKEVMMGLNSAHIIVLLEAAIRLGILKKEGLDESVQDLMG